MNGKPDIDKTSTPFDDVAPDLSPPGADVGANNGGSGADSGGTGAGTTALDAIGSQGNLQSEVASHLRIKHKVGGQPSDPVIPAKE